MRVPDQLLCDVTHCGGTSRTGVRGQNKTGNYGLKIMLPGEISAATFGPHGPVKLPPRSHLGASPQTGPRDVQGPEPERFRDSPPSGTQKRKVAETDKKQERKRNVNGFNRVGQFRRFFFFRVFLFWQLFLRCPGRVRGGVV